jgi:hypothetical protein
MAHAHTQIRQALKTALTGLASTADRVFANLLYPLEESTLPALRLYTDDDQATAMDIGQPHLQMHELGLIVECCAMANTGLDDLCDQIQLEVETALAAGLTVGAAWLSPQLQSSRYDDDIRAQPVAIKRLRYSLTYMTQNTAPDTLI